MAATTDDVRGAVKRLAAALLDDVERIALRCVARIQALVPSYAKMPAEVLLPVTLTNIRNLLEAVCDPGADPAPHHEHFRRSGETRAVQRISADEMLQAWHIGLEVVREEAHQMAERLGVADPALLQFVEATLECGDVGMRRSAAGHREHEIRELESLAAEQAALRRVAELVARHGPPEELFELVTEELSRLLEVTIVRTVRFEADHTATVLAAHGVTDGRLSQGENFPIPDRSPVAEVLRTGRPARLDDFAVVAGPVGSILREQGAGAGVAGPIVVDGHLWGAMAIGALSPEALPPGSEDRVAKFAELVSTAISNVESRERMERLAAEQSALRRVAELVARQAPPDEVFAVVTGELSRLLGVSMVRTIRFEPDNSVTVLAAHGITGDRLPPGTNVPIPEGSLIEDVFRTGRPARLADYSRVRGPIGAILRAQGARSGVGGPIVVDGRLWGEMVVASQTAETLPLGSEHRVTKFAELVSTAISNMESRAKVEELAAEQAVLRRVAELVAGQPPPEQVFALVTSELTGLFGAGLMVRTVKFESDETATILAAHGAPEGLIPPGSNTPRPEGGILDQVFRTGRPGRVDDYAQVAGPLAAALRAAGIRSAAAGPIVVAGRVWGAMAVASTERLPHDTEHRVAQFAELVSTAISNLESRARVEELAAEQAALRRVAELVARQAPADQVFGLVTEELNRLLDVATVATGRFEPDGTVTIMAVRGKAETAFPPGTSVPLEGGSAIERVLRTGRPAHIESYDGVGGQLGGTMRELGAGWAASGPIVVDGRLWGAMSVNSGAAGAYPAGTEQRVAQFAELVSTAISNIESRGRIERLAAEQSALRRVATMVAREYSPDDLFATLVQEIGVLLQVDAAAILRYEDDASATVMAGWSDGVIELPVGARFSLEGENLSSEVRRTGLAQRKSDYADAPGEIAAAVRELGLRSAVASPIVAEGASWGLILVLSGQPEPLPPDTETRIAEFTRQAGLAVANAKSRADLAKSRARIVRAGDEARRRFERDLHDGAQQRIVSLGLELRATEANAPPELADLRGRLSRLAAGLNAVLDDLRELSRGLHPAVLSEDGLAPALGSLALRSAVPVDLRVDFEGERFEEAVEVAAYYVASEALANTAKHAHASRAEVRAGRQGEWLALSVSDDGEGGAERSKGSGLTGLADRVEAIGGTLEIESPHGLGTVVRVRLPVTAARR
jgi:GAF domain-containing protein